jgi:hypothetical protein
VTFTPTPAASAPAAARVLNGAGERSLAPAVNASASASAASSSVSLCAPPIASTSSTGFRPTNAIAQLAECPRRAAARAISAIAPRLETTAIALNAHSPPASPSGTSA